MANYIYEGSIKDKTKIIKVRLLLIHFRDDNEVHFIYSPHLDLTGYGMNIEEAKESFETALQDFIEYTLQKKTLGKVLKELGWELKGSLKRPKKVIAPSITSVIKENDYVSEIFDKYPVNTFHEEVGLPAFV